MNDDRYFPVPLAHLTSPYVPPTPPPEDASPPPAASHPSPPPRPHHEPWGMLDAEEPPETYGVDEVTVLARDPYTLFAHWEVTPATRATVELRLGERGILVLRLSAASGPVIDDRLPADVGRGYLPAPFPGALLVPILGLRGEDGGFEPIMSAPPIRVPWSHPEEGPVEWMEIEPSVTRGAIPEPPLALRRGVIPQGEGNAWPGSGDTMGLLPSAPVEHAPAAPMPSAPDDATPAPVSPTSPAGGPAGR